MSLDSGKKRVLLIGGAGFIGHNLALGLARQGHEVFVVDGMEVNNLLSFVNRSSQTQGSQFYIRLINERLDLLRQAKIPLVVQDARDYPALCRVFTEIAPQVVIHLAAVAHANISNKDPYSTFDHSLRTLENALDVSRGRVEHFIYFSSSMIYGNFPDGHVTEETVCNPLGIYGALKLAGEKMVIAYHQVFDLQYTIVRPSALYGERCVSRRVGQIFIENAMRDLEISVNGDGKDRLDFTYIGDLVQGLCRVVEQDKAKNQTFNLTYGQSRSIAEMETIVREHFPEIKVKHTPQDKLTPSRGTLSIAKARDLLGYAPEFPLEQGLERYINWYKNLTKDYFSFSNISA